MENTATPTLCRICLRSCGILVRPTSNGIRIKGNPEHPISKGFICFRGAHYHRIWGSDQRLKEPLLRRGNRWLPISYDDALGILAEKINLSRKAHGIQSVAFLKGESLKHQEISGYMKHLAHALGTPNYFSIGSMCQRANVMGHDLTYGGIPKLDRGRHRAAVLWGRNIAVASVATFKDLHGAVKEGMRLLVIDPNFTRTAEIADMHLPITPGTDGLLALAFIKKAVEDYNLAPDAQRQVGWGQLKDHVTGLSYDVLLEKIGIAKEDFSRASQLIFENLPAYNQTGLGLELLPNGVQAIRAVACLHSLVDPARFPSAMAMPVKPLPNREAYPERPDPVGCLQNPLFFKRGGEGQAMYLPQAVFNQEPYPIKLLFVAGANPALTFPATSTQIEMYKQLDFFAVCDLFMTATARRADLVLPAVDFLNSMEVHDYGRVGKPYLGLIRPIPHEAPGWPVWKWVFKLAHALGLEKFFPWENNEAALSYRLGGTQVELDTLKASPASVAAYRPAVEDDAFRKVHYFSAEAETAANMGLTTADTLELPFTTDADFPLWLSTGDRVRAYQHSQFRISDFYLKIEPEPRVDIHPETAELFSIHNGDRVKVTTRYGEVMVQARLTDEVRKDSLRMLHGWEEANINELTGLEHLDPLSGFPWCRALPARIANMAG